MATISHNGAADRISTLQPVDMEQASCGSDEQRKPPLPAPDSSWDAFVVFAAAAVVEGLLFGLSYPISHVCLGRQEPLTMQ
jgi:hypothetical protein